MKYAAELTKAMDFLAENPQTIFLGQAVEYPGTAMSSTLKNISKEKLLEIPVAEEMQLGITNGLALNNFIPVSIFPRWNFLLLAANQLINHLDKLSVMSQGKFKTKVHFIIHSKGEAPSRPFNLILAASAALAASTFVLKNPDTACGLSSPLRI